jgi:type II secretory pathway component PulJ
VALKKPPFAGLASRAGATLVEVVVAMVLLAVGLLALQAMGMAALHSVGVAERNSRAVAMASRYLEEALEQLRQDRLPAPFACTLASGDEIARVVVEVGDPQLVEVRVQVTPETRGATPQPYTVSAYVFSPRGFSPATDSSACP